MNVNHVDQDQVETAVGIMCQPDIASHHQENSLPMMINEVTCTRLGSTEEDCSPIYAEQFCDVILEENLPGEVSITPFKGEISEAESGNNNLPEAFGSEEQLDKVLNLVYNPTKVPVNTLQPVVVKSNQMYLCSGCSYTSKHRGNIKMHIKAVHYRLRPHQCPKCKYSAPYKGKLLSHIKTVHKKEKPFKCQKCPFTAFQKHSLTGHMYTYHNDKQSSKNSRRSKHKEGLVCSECFLAFNSEDELEEHARNVHVEKLYHCDSCTFSTFTRSNLSVHRSSEHQKSFKCTLCPYIGLMKSDLTIHMRAVHKKLKPYACDQCLYATGYLGSLKKHVHIHHSNHADVEAEDTGGATSARNDSKSMNTRTFEDLDDSINFPLSYLKSKVS